MFGGNVPPIPTPQGGGGQDMQHQKADELGLRLKKMREQDDEDWFLIITQWVVENNSN